MGIKVEKLEIEGLILIEPNVFNDSRGNFFESYNREDFRAIGIDYEFLQDNQSVSNRGVLRGMHYQEPPFEQGKLVRVVKGSVIDVVVDLRLGSVSYGKSINVLLSGGNNKILWIPPGFAHGFLSLEDETVFVYKCTKVYNKDYERAILWNDKDLNIKWNFENPIVSDKDNKADLFKDIVSKF